MLVIGQVEIDWAERVLNGKTNDWTVEDMSRLLAEYRDDVVVPKLQALVDRGTPVSGQELAELIRTLRGA